MKNKIKVYIIAIFFAALLIVGGTFAFWSFTSNDKSIVFNTASNLRKYINYDSGESHFSGTLVVGENYSYGIHSTISVSKSEEARNITLMGTIYMDINEIGENMRNSSALKWALTSGDSTNVGTLLAEGNFIGAPVGDSLILLPSFEVTTTVQKFTVWIWLDESEHPSEALSGETLDTNVWVEINQVEGTTEDFIVTQINANYQIITATAVNNRHNIDGYKVTTSSEEPSSWEPVASPSRIYNIPEYSDTQVGQTYYVWFKDTEGHTAREPIEITQSDTTRPSCTWGTFNPNSIGNGDTATISLTCTDSGSGIVNSNITTSNITTTNEKIQVTNISKEATTGGYIYTVTVTGISDVDGIDKLTLAADSVKDGTKNGNLSVISGEITISNASIITINAGYGISSISGTNLTYDSTTGKATGTFNNGSTINLSTLTITYKTGYSGTNYIKNSGEGTLSGSTFTVGTGDGTLTINSTTLAEPLCNLRNTSPFTAIYNNSDGLIQAPANSNNYDSGVNVTFQFGYASNSTDALGNFVESDINSYTVSKTLYRGTRYYGAKVTATGDGGLTATCTTPSGSYREITYVNARIDFDSSADGGTITGTSPLYVGYGDANLYTGRTNTTAGTIPTATPSTGYAFDGWYTAASGGTKVINANGTLAASVSGWTDSSGNWILTSTSDTENTNKLYAQFSPQSYTVTFDPDDGTVSPTTKSVVYDSQYGSLPTPTKTGYSFLGWNGKNLFDEETILMAIPGATYTDNHYVYGIINAKNKYGGSNSLPIQGFKSSTRYTYSIYGYVDGGRETFYFTYAEGGQSYGNFQTNEEKMITIRSNANKTISKLTLSYGNDDNGVSASGKYAHVTHIQLEEGTTVTPFEPYYVLSTTNVTQAKDHTLTAKWSPNTYTITLDNQSATTAGTSTIYEKYDNGVCLNSNCSTVMTTSTNGITVPTKTGYTFGGYYDDVTEMIANSGFITSEFTNTKYSSNKTLTARWIDDIAPTGNVNASLNGNDIVATVTASDDGSGASSTYGWKISTSSTCGPTVSDFIDSTNASYSFTPTSSGTWYVCVRIEDNAGNKAYLSTSIEKTGITASSISYTGTWGGVQDEGDDNWYAVITGDGTLTFTSSGEIEVFMVGGGGAGGTGIKGVSYTGYSDPGLGGGGGGGGYRTTDTITVSSGTNYSVVIGAGGTKASGSTAASSGGTTSIKNGSTTLLSANGGNAGGNGSGTTPGAGGIGGSNGGKGAKINDSASYTTSVAGGDGEYAFGSSYYGNKYGAGGGGGGAKSGNNFNAWYQTYNSGRSAPSGDYGGPNDGGYGGTPNAAGKDGNYYGAAGGGGGSGSSYTVGGNGYQGIIIIRNVRDGSSSGGSSSSSSSGSTGLYTRVVTECYKEVYGSSTNGNYSNLSSCSSSCNSLNGGACYPNQNAGYTCYYCPAGGVLDGSLKCYYYYTSSTSSLVSSCTPATNFNQCTGTAGTQNAVNITCTPQ